MDFDIVTSVAYANSWRSEKARNNYINESLDSLPLVQSQLRMDIDIAFDSMLFMPTACFLVLSWTLKELFFNHYMSTFAIKKKFSSCMYQLCRVAFSYILCCLCCTFVWFGLAWLPAVGEKCGFLLAEDIRTYLFHTIYKVAVSH